MDPSHPRCLCYVTRLSLNDDVLTSYRACTARIYCDRGAGRLPPAVSVLDPAFLSLSSFITLLCTVLLFMQSCCCYISKLLV
ncbi:hypothetical protein ABKN59_005852 [Abortiporus biennis]